MSVADLVLAIAERADGIGHYSSFKAHVLLMVIMLFNLQLIFSGDPSVTTKRCGCLTGRHAHLCALPQSCDPRALGNLSGILGYPPCATPFTHTATPSHPESATVHAPCYSRHKPPQTKGRATTFLLSGFRVLSATPCRPVHMQKHLAFNKIQYCGGFAIKAKSVCRLGLPGLLAGVFRNKLLVRSHQGRI